MFLRNLRPVCIIYVFCDRSYSAIIVRGKIWLLPKRDEKALAHLQTEKIMYLFCFSGVYEHIRNRASLSDTYPYFDATSERNVTSFVGQVTHLHCTVRDIGDRTVSRYISLNLH